MKHRIKQLIERTGFQISRRPKNSGEAVYDRDGLRTAHDHGFMNTPRFQAAYQRGVRAAGEDYKWQWRVHVGLWAAETASRVPGDFVECGVNRGFMSSAIMHDLDWNKQNRLFYLLDTFEGLDLAQADHEEKWRNDFHLDGGFYVQGAEGVRANFSEWKNACVIQGSFPATLDQVPSERIAFLSLDMNCAAPEVAALHALWPRLSPGAIILSDDYCYNGYPGQKAALDTATAELGATILSLPTGQGLIIKR